MNKKTIVIGSLLAVCLLMLVPCIPAIQVQATKADIQKTITQEKVSPDLKERLQELIDQIKKNSAAQQLAEKIEQNPQVAQRMEKLHTRLKAMMPSLDDGRSVFWTIVGLLTWPIALIVLTIAAAIIGVPGLLYMLGSMWSDFIGDTEKARARYMTGVTYLLIASVLFEIGLYWPEWLPLFIESNTH